jgi:hypothetical protein
MKTFATGTCIVEQSRRSLKTGGNREENGLLLVPRVRDAFDGVWFAKKRWHL